MLYIIIAISVAVNASLLWYLYHLLKKLMFISQNMSDLFLTIKSFTVFVSDLYSMDNYHGEPIIQEMITKLKEVTSEMEYFREVFEYTIDEDLEEELEELLDAEEKIEEE